MTKISDLSDIILKAQVAYYNGSSIIDDDEYDALLYELECLDPNNKLLKSVGAPGKDEWKKEKHLTTLGSLSKVNTPSEMRDWLDLTGKGRQVIVTEKLDGLSIGCQYENGKLIKSCLRGNGIEGENILQNVLKMRGVLKKFHNFNGTLRGEIILKKSNHQKYFPDYSNPRNAASGICRDLKGDGAKHLDLMLYQVIGDDDCKTEQEQLELIKNAGGTVPNYYICNSDVEITEVWNKYQNGLRDSLDWEIDGIVISFSDLEFQYSLGESNDLRPKGKKAFKFANQFVKTTVNNVTWTCGGSGRITPICWFTPVSLLGSIIEKASVYNIAYIEKLKLSIGADVLVCKANEIIPRVEKVVKSGNNGINIPTKCPSCNYELVMEGEYLICNNRDACPDQLHGRLCNWISELNILEWGTALLQQLIDSGKVKDISDLYLLTVEDLASLDRMGEKSAKKCHKLLWEGSEISLDIMVGGLSIPMIGSSTIRQLMSAGIDSLDKLLKANVSDFEKVSGIGPNKAQSLYDGLKKNQDLITRLIKNGVKVKEKVHGKLSGSKFAITGTLSMKRAEVEKMIMDAGGEMQSSVGKTTTYLVIQDVNSNSSKAVSAKKLGVKLINENDLMGMLKNE